MIKLLRRIKSDWISAPFMPPRELTIQSSGICFTSDHNIVLVNDGKNWQLPGGAPEKYESIEEALIREIDEEACAEVIDFKYLGCIRNMNLFFNPNDNMPLYYKARFWVRIKLNAFNPKHEILERNEILPEQFVARLSWNAQKKADEILYAALMVEKEKVNT